MVQDKLKHRLIGLGVILLSAGILFPLFFDGAGYRERHLETVIPAAPPAPEVVSITPQTVTLPDTTDVAPAQPVTPAPAQSEVLIKAVEAAKPAISIDEDKPVLDDQGVPVAWTLQLATFSDEGNARDLRDKLIDAGHKVFTRKNGNLVKVYVGPDFQRSKLEALKEQLQKDFKLDGIIVRFSTR